MKTNFGRRRENGTNMEKSIMRLGAGEVVSLGLFFSSLFQIPFIFSLATDQLNDDEENDAPLMEKDNYFWGIGVESGDVIRLFTLANSQLRHCN